MSLRDDAWDIYERLGDMPYAVWYPRIPVASGLTVVCDIPVEWQATPAPVTPAAGGSAPFVTRFPRPKADKERRKTCITVPPIYAGHRARARAHIGSTVEIGSISAGHTRRVVDPLPGILIEDEEFVMMLAALE